MTCENDKLQFAKRANQPACNLPQGSRLKIHATPRKWLVSGVLGKRSDSAWRKRFKESCETRNYSENWRLSGWDWRWQADASRPGRVTWRAKWLWTGRRHLTSMKASPYLRESATCGFPGSMAGLETDGAGREAIGKGRRIRALSGMRRISNRTAAITTGRAATGTNASFRPGAAYRSHATRSIAPVRPARNGSIPIAPACGTRSSGVWRIAACGF